MANLHTNKSSFIISLDLELLWGVRGKRTIGNYGDNLKGVKQVVPALLDLFEKFEVNTTWATVGFLFAKDKEELIHYSPQVKPMYSNSGLSPYAAFDNIGSTEEEDPYHFGYSLVQMIKACKGQELASHTFSHYYCLERGQTEQTFAADVEAAIKIASKEGVELKSIVFPKNQLNCNYIYICESKGFTNYRGNEKSWIYKERNDEQQTLFKRGARLLDSYFNISGHNTYKFSEISKSFPYNIPASRFLRPFIPNLRVLDQLRLRRIKRAMSHAAKNGEMYHLWWHPHNFGKFLLENLQFLEKILIHFQQLRKKYGMSSMTMGEVANQLMTERHG